MRRVLGSSFGRAATGAAMLAAGMATLAPSPVASAEPVTVQTPAVAGYLPPVAVAAPGDGLFFDNTDPAFTHTLTAADQSGGRPLFHLRLAPGGRGFVPGSDSVPSGTYQFFCELHPWMRGVYVVTDD